MNFMKRAFLSLIRRKGKSLILLTIIFILSNVMAGSIAIGQASRNVEKTMKQQLGANASVEMDWEKMQDWTEEQWQNVQYVTPDMADQIGALPYVKYYDYNTEAYINSTSLKMYDPNMMDQEYNYFPLRGVNYAPVLDIANGTATLVEGRVFSDEDIVKANYVVLISDKLAEQNNVFVGDIIMLNNEFQIWKEGDVEPEKIVRDIALEVIGIFSPKVNTNQEENGGWIDYTPFNRMYVPNGVVNAENRWMNEQYMIAYPDSGITPDQLDRVYINPVFVLNNPEEVESFRTEAMTYLPDYYKVNVSSDAYDSVAGPIKFIGSLSNTILYVAIGATILILSLVVILFLRDRKHELGIYLSLGESKSKVMAQILIEVVAIAILGITLSLFTGNSIAEATSQSMMDLRAGIEGEGPDYPIYKESYVYNPGGITEEDVMEAYSIQFSWDYVLILYGVGVGTVLLSSIAPMIYILRLKPKKIMM